MSTLSKLGVTCPKGGSFYVCDDKPAKFIGCCTVDPCKTNDGDCPSDDLRYTSYDKFSHNLLLAQDCQSAAADVQWYTCAAITTPFMGCCSINPCSDGCPTKNLYSAKLSDVEENAAIFLPDDSGDGSSGGLSKGAIGGIAAGGAVVLLLIAIAIWWFRRSRKNKTANKGPEGYEPYAGQPGIQSPMSGYGSPMAQKGQMSPFTQQYPSYQSTPNPDHHAAWRESQYSQGMTVSAPSAYSSGMVSPPPPQFQHNNVQTAYTGHQQGIPQNFVQELPDSSAENGAKPASWVDQKQAVEMEAPYPSPRH